MSESNTPETRPWSNKAVTLFDPRVQNFPTYVIRTGRRDDDGTFITLFTFMEYSSMSNSSTSSKEITLTHPELIQLRDHLNELLAWGNEVLEENPHRPSPSSSPDNDDAVDRIASFEEVMENDRSKVIQSKIHSAVIESMGNNGPSLMLTRSICLELYRLGVL